MNNKKKPTGRPTDSIQKKKSKEVITCPVCEDSIADPSNKSDGDDSVFCEGSCNVWFHRRCAGLSIQAFKKLTISKEPFMCYQCSLVKHKDEIAYLKQMIQDLSKEVSEIKNKVPESDVKSKSNAMTTQPKFTNKQTAKAPNAISQSHNTERNFNIVIYGINESPPGTSKSYRVKADLDKFLPVISEAESTITAKSVKDFHRLGRYKEKQERPRPILVKFLSALDANAILSNRSNISPPVVIKPDMSKEDRVDESILLSERWNLIQSGTDRKFIKIRNKQIFVNNRLHGSILASKFSKVNTSCRSITDNGGATDSDMVMEDHAPDV